jgi:hypothetical protein
MGIAFRNDVGQMAVWDVNGTTITGGGTIADPGASQSIVGGSNRMQFIYSGAADETLTATPTLREEFVFTDFAAGAHTISGFNTVQDVVELSSALFADFAAVQAATTATAGGALIALDHSSSLLLAGVDPTSLHASNFVLGGFAPG